MKTKAIIAAVAIGFFISIIMALAPKMSAQTRPTELQQLQQDNQDLQRVVSKYALYVQRVEDLNKNLGDQLDYVLQNLKRIQTAEQLDSLKVAFQLQPPKQKTDKKPETKPAPIEVYTTPDSR